MRSVLPAVLLLVAAGDATAEAPDWRGRCAALLKRAGDAMARLHEGFDDASTIEIYGSTEDAASIDETPGVRFYSGWEGEFVINLAPEQDAPMLLFYEDPKVLQRRSTRWAPFPPDTVLPGEHLTEYRFGRGVVAVIDVTGTSAPLLRDFAKIFKPAIDRCLDQIVRR